MTPVAFAYGGWQTASFVAGEMRDPRRDLSRGLMAGVSGVVLLYLAVNFVCLRGAGAGGAGRDAHAGVGRDARGAGRARRVLDRGGHRDFDAGIPEPGDSDGAPRVLRDGARRAVLSSASARFHRARARRWSRSCCRASLATVIALTGRYEQILNYEVSVDFIAFGLTAAALFVLRRRAGVTAGDVYLTPGHPYTTALFVAGLRGNRRQHDRQPSGRQRRRPALFCLRAFPYICTGAAEILHEAATFRLHALGQDPQPGPIQPGHERRRALSLAARFRFEFAQLEINGDSSYGYAPLQRRDRRQSAAVDPDCVVAAAGTSMANHLAMAALLDPGRRSADRASRL